MSDECIEIVAALIERLACDVYELEKLQKERDCWELEVTRLGGKIEGVKLGLSRVEDAFKEAM